MKPFIAIISVLFLLCTSCATTTLWEATDPDKYIQIKFTDITERELQEKDVKYIKDEKTHLYYVDKSSAEKFAGYAIRVFATPVTVVVDATTVMIFGIALAFTEGAIEDNKVDPDSDPHGPGERD